MINRYPVQLTTLEEDFRAIGIIPERQLVEADDSTIPRDIPSPDSSVAAGDDSGSTPARHKYAKQPKPRMTPDDKDDHDDPEEAGASQGKALRAVGKYVRVPGGKDATLESKSYTAMRQVAMSRAKDKGQAPAIAKGLKSVKKTSGMKSRMESTNVSRAAELVGEVEALLAGSQMGEDFNNLHHGFSLISENCSLLANRLVDLAEHYNVDDAIDAMEDLYNNAIEASQIIEEKAKKKADRDDDDDSDDDEDDDDDSAMESIKDAFRIMTLQLMDAVESYDSTLSAMNESDDDDDDSDDDDDDSDDDDDDDDDSDDDKGGIAARMAKLRGMQKGKKGPFGK